MKLISASLTANQVRRSVDLVKQGKPPLKDVTRRLGWKNLKPGERLQVCEKVMGRRKGQPIVKLAVIEIVSVRRERLGCLLRCGYGTYEVSREGFGAHTEIRTAKQFVQFFCHTHKGCTPETIVTRIEFKYII
jgi:hypothetical protein